MIGEIEDLEQRILRVESALILLAIGAIAAADRLVAADASLGFLYLVPLSYSALAHRWPWFLWLTLLCVALRPRGRAGPRPELEPARLRAGR